MNSIITPLPTSEIFKFKTLLLTCVIKLQFKILKRMTNHTLFLKFDNVLLYVFTVKISCYAITNIYLLLPMYYC